MDSFTTISIASKAPATDIPSDNEGTGSGQGSGGYCVIFAKDISAVVPSDEEVPVAEPHRHPPILLVTPSTFARLSRPLTVQSPPPSYRILSSLFIDRHAGALVALIIIP
ncbi:hypothetical protein D9611_014155 [Ephemerocybe angulata]|uniref:Uncharacterized protein n=1 Tax=Ephemerocybe angulata TaxID=980116 RepID=A0A8H5FEY4_9AGAR|nr:hypothetical protein D9611_014155 [Tulosesus angulatus]